MSIKSIYKYMLVALLLGLSLCVQAAVSIQTVKDMRVLKQQAKSAQLPVLLMFTAEDCGFCDAIKKNYLLPMIRTGKYADSILFKQLDVDEYNYLRNAKGELAGGDQLALKYDVEVVPTIIFINAEGKELAERIVGISSADYFDQLLATQILQANKALNLK